MRLIGVESEGSGTEEGELHLLTRCEHTREVSFSNPSGPDCIAGNRAPQPLPEHQASCSARNWASVDKG